MTVLLRPFATVLALVLVFLLSAAASLLAQTPDRIVSPVRSDLPGRTVWAFATTGTGTNVTTFAATDKGLYRSSGGAWTLAGLGNQSVYAVKSRRVGNTTTLLAGTNKGIMRSTDGGNSWASPEVTTGTVSTSNILSLKKVFDIEIVQPGNGNGNGNAGIWFAATEKGVFRSTNDGRSWSLVNIDRTADNNEVRGITVDGSTIIVNLWKEGLWRSTNNGNSWSKLSIAGETALCRAVHVQQGTSATVWLAGSVSGNIWRSVNNGTSWTRVYQGTNAARTASPSALAQAGIDAFAGQGHIVFASTPTGIAYSRSYGQTWAHTRTTTPQAMSMVMLGNQVFVGLEQNSSSGVGKGASSLTNIGDGANTYTGYCPPELNFSGTCSSGGGGGTGAIIPNSPYISNVTPNPATQNTAAITITISGTEFNGSQVQISPAQTISWQKLSTPSLSATQIQAVVPAAFANTVGVYRLRVYNGSEVEPTVNTPMSQEVFWTVQPGQPAIPTPQLTGLTTTPSPVILQQAATLTLTGNNFAANPTVRLYNPSNTITNLTLTGTGNSSSQLTVTLPAQSVAGRYNVDVLNPGNPTATQQKDFTVSNPQVTLNAPTLTSATPVPVATQALTVSATGTGLIQGTTQVSLTNPSGGAVTTFTQAPTIAGNTLTFAFNPSAGGDYTLTVRNDGTSAGTSTASRTFNVLTPPSTPSINTLTQNGQTLTSVTIGAAAQSVVLGGSNFTATSVVRMTANGTTTDLTPTSWSSSALTVTIPATAFQTALHTISLAAVTPPLYGVGGGTSQTTLSLPVVLPAPVLNGITPEFVQAGAPSTVMTIFGTGIIPNQTLMRWVVGRDTVLYPIEPGNIITLATSVVRYSTVATVQLLNPRWQNLGGGASTTIKEFIVRNTTPRLDSISPRRYAWFGVETSMSAYIYGDFIPSTVFRVQNGSMSADLRPAPQDFSTTRVLLTIPFASVGLTPPGTVTVRAMNPRLLAQDPDLFSLRTDTLGVVNPAPRIFTAAPEYPITSLPQTITLDGEAFVVGVSASIAGINAPVQRQSANRIIVTLDAAVQSRVQALGAGVHHLIVRNPAPALAEASLPITLTNPAIVTLIVSPIPHTLTAPPSAQTVTLTALQSSGTPYIATNATVSFRGQTFPIASRPAQDRITASIPASLLGEAGNYPITVNQPAVVNAQGQSVGASTQQAAWVLNNPRPVLGSMTTNPTPVIAGAEVVLTLDGSAFVPLAKVVVRGAEYTPSTNTGTRLTVTIPASALDSAGAFPVTVRNPQGGGDALNQPLLTVLAPRPRLTTLAPANAVLNLVTPDALTLTLNGSGFVRGSRLLWNILGSQATIPTAYQSANSLTATIPAAFLQQAGVYRLTVVNDSFAGQGGGTADTLTFTLNNPFVNLTAVAPNLLPRFAAGQALTLTVSNVVSGARVLVTGLNNVVDTLAAQVLSPTQMTTTLPASLLDTATTLYVRVLNPAPTQGASGQQPAMVVNPRPRLTALSQTSVLTGVPSLTLTASGSALMDGVQAFANGVAVATQRTNDQSAVLTLPASALAQAGEVRITLQNPTPRVQPDLSDTLTLTVTNPLPRLDSATTPLMVSTQASVVTLFGENFIVASAVKENGSGRTESTLAASRTSLTQMTATIPATMTAEAGTVSLAVENPTPGGGRSQSVSLPVLHPVPTAQRITPSVVTIPTSDVSIVVTGDRFVNTVEVLVGGQSVAITQRSATRLTGTIPAAMLATRGFVPVTVRNPATNGNDGGTADTLWLRVNTPQPVLSALAPAQIPLDTVDVPMVITGTRFLDEATVRLTTPDGTNVSVATTSITPTEIRLVLPVNLINRGGIYTLRVENPAPTDSPSAPMTFALVNPVPQMDSIAPTVITGGTTPQTITIYGQKFTPTSVVRWRGQDLATTFVSRTTLTAVVPETQQRRGAVGAVTVFTPTDGVVVGGNPVGGGTGSAQGLAGVLTVLHGAPALASASPAVVLRDAWSASALPSVTLNGAMFASTATVRVQSSLGMTVVDTVITPSSVNANTQSLVLTLPRAVVVTAGTFTLTVQNPPAFPNAALPNAASANDGGTSASLSVTVQNPTPALASLAPAALAAAAPNTLVTVNGANFTRETQLFVNGAPAPRTILSATQLTTTLPASLFTLSGFVAIQTLNPAPSLTGAPSGDSSNTLQLEIFNPVPTLTSVAPVFAPIGGRAPQDSVTLTLVGTNFVRNSVARLATTVAGAPTTNLPTTFVATTTLTVRLLAADWRAQAYNVTVLNPTPRGGVSPTARRFTVTNPIPVLTALLPNSTTASGRAWTLRVVGNFFTSTSQVSYNRALQSLANTQYRPNSLTAGTQDTLLVKLVAVPVGDTTFPVVVVNPATGGVGGGASDTLRLAIGLPAPTITTLSPASTTATLGDVNRVWTLTVNGTLFDDQAKVVVNGVVLPTEFVSTTRLRVVLPDSMQHRQARRTVQVRNTPVLQSNIVQQTVHNPAPVLMAMEPSTIIAGRDTVLVLTGDRFAPDATVRLTLGATTTVVAPSRRDSVIRITIPLPSSLIPSRGAYSVQVVNRALALDTTTVGGGADALPLTVNADVVKSIEYVGVDTLLYANDRMPFITLRFRDKTGNLVDNDPVTLSYHNLDSAAITGTFPITRLSLGNYRADTLRFPTAGDYRLHTDTTSSGRLVIVGANRFAVLTRPAVRVEITGLQETLTAGETQRLQVRYYDNQGNLTDNTIRPVTATAPLLGGYRYVLGYTRIGTGVYDIEALRLTTSGNYTLSFTSIDTLNITGNGTPYNRRFTVQPTLAAAVRFTNVLPLLTAGGAQNRFTAAFRDGFGNLTDALTTQQLVVNYTNSTKATLGDSIVTGALTLSRLSLGTYQTDIAERFPTIGSYIFSIPGITATTGTAAFRVQAAGDARVEFAAVPDTLTAGDSLKAVTLKYWDANGNLTDNALGDVFLTKRSPAPTFTARMSKTRLSAGVYALQSTHATLAGAYDLTVQGINATNTTGNNRFVLLPSAVTTVNFVITTTAMTRTGALASINATYRDRFGNLTDFAGDLTLTNAEFASVATISMVRAGQGVYNGQVRLYAPGDYAVQIAGTSAGISIGGTEQFALEPGPAVTADFQNVLPAINAGAAQSAFSVLLRDRRGSPTDVWNGAIGFTAPLTVNTYAANGTVSYGWSAANYGLLLATPSTFTGAGAYTLALDGGITRYNGNRVFVVQPDTARNVHILTTPANPTITAGATVSVRVRATDRFGNRTPLAASVRLEKNGSVLATAPLVATNVRGEYTAAFRPATAGTLTIAIGGAAISGALTLTGTTAVTVLPTTDYRVELEGVRTSMIAGEAQSQFTVTYRDLYGNLTDSTVGAVIVRPTIGTQRDTVRMQRLAQGQYRADALTLTKAGSYLVTISGIAAANIEGDSAFVVAPDAPAKALFQSVTAAINVGANLPVFTVRYRDRFDNPMEFEGVVGFTNAASPFVQAGLTPPNSGVIPMTRTAAMVSTSTLQAVTIAGDYALTVRGISTLAGTTAFTVRPLAAASAEIRNLQERLSAGDSLPPFVVLYRDRLGNVADYNRNLTLTRVGTTASLTVPMKRLAIGVSTATAATPLLAPGTYNLTVPGMATVSGATTVVVTSTNAVSKVDFWGVTPVITAGATLASFSLTFQNAQGGFVDYTTAIVRYRNTVGTSSGTLALTRQDVGVYEVESIRLTTAGNYRFTVDGISSTTGTNTFVVQPDSIIVARVDSLVSEGTMGQAIPPFTVKFFDQFNNRSIAMNSLQFIALNDSTRADSRWEVNINSNGLVSGFVLSSMGTYRLVIDSTILAIGNREITIKRPRPAITSVFPREFEFATEGMLVIEGANFQPNAQIWFGGRLLDAEFISPTQLQIPVPMGLTVEARQDTIYVVNTLDNQQSNNTILTVKKGGAELQSQGSTVTIDQNETHTYGLNISNSTLQTCGSNQTTTVDLIFTNPSNINQSCGSELRYPFNSQTGQLIFTIPQIAKDFRCLGAGTYSPVVQVYCNGTATGSRRPVQGNFTVYNPAPTVTSINVTGVGDQIDLYELKKFRADTNIKFTVTGTGFVYDSEIAVPTQNNACSGFLFPIFKQLEDKDKGTTLSFSIFNRDLLNLLPNGQRECKFNIVIKNNNQPSGGSASVTKTITVINSGAILREDIRITPNRYRFITDNSKETYKLRGYNLVSGAFTSNTSLFFEYSENGRKRRDSLQLGPFVTSLSNGEQEIGFEINPLVYNPNNIFTNVGEYKIIVRNNTTGKETRENIFFYTVPIAPKLDSIQANDEQNLTQMPRGGRAARLVVNGSNFDDLTTVSVNGINTTKISGNKTRIIVSVPEAAVRTGQNVNVVSVTNQPITLPEVRFGIYNQQIYSREIVGGGTASGLRFSAIGIQPSLTSIRPRKVIAQVYDTTFTLIGDNLTPESRVVYYQGNSHIDTLTRGASRGYDSVGYDPACQCIKVKIKGSVLEVGVDSMSVVNPSGIANTLFASQSLPFNIYEADDLPRVDSITPQYVLPNMGRTITLYGVNFQPGTLLECILIPKFGGDNIVIVKSGQTPPPMNTGNYKGIHTPRIKANSTTEMEFDVPNDFVKDKGKLLFRPITKDSIGFVSDSVVLDGTKVSAYGQLPIDTPPQIIGPIETYSKYLESVPGFLNIGTIKREKEKIEKKLLTGIPDLNQRQEYFIIRGKDFDAKDGSEILFDNKPVSDVTTISDTEIQFSIPSLFLRGLGNELTTALTFSSGNHTFKIRSKSTGIQSEVYTQKVFARSPTIEKVSTFRIPFARPQPINRTVRVWYKDSVIFHIYSGGQDAPGAKNFVEQSRVLVNNLFVNNLNTSFIPYSGVESLGLTQSLGNTDDAYSIRVSVPANMLRSYNLNTIIVQNPNTESPPEDSRSKPFTFFADIIYPRPTVSSVTPPRLVVDGGDTTFIIRGTNLLEQSTVSINFTRIDTLGNLIETSPAQESLTIRRVIDSTGLEVFLPAKWRSQVGYDSLIVCNPGPGNCTDFRIKIVPQPPAILAVFPDTLDAGVPEIAMGNVFVPGTRRTDTLLITGNGFVGGIQALWDTTRTPLSILNYSATSMAVVVPDTLHSKHGFIPLTLFVPEDSAQGQRMMVLAYPKTRVDRLQRDTIYVSPVLLAWKDDDGSLQSDSFETFRPLPGVSRELPLRVSLLPNSPNPFSAATTVRYAIPKAARVRLEVFDALGRRVVLLADSDHKAGEYEALWQTGNSASGTYIAQIIVTEPNGTVQRQTLSITLIR